MMLNRISIEEFLVCSARMPTSGVTGVCMCVHSVAAAAAVIDGYDVLCFIGGKRPKPPPAEGLCKKPRTASKM